MSTTRDPFLTQILIVVDRVTAWLCLVAVSTALVWSLVWQNGLGYSGSAALGQFATFMRGRAERPDMVVGMLILAVAVLASSLLAVWLFQRWRKQASLRAEHVRGARLEDQA